MRISNDKSRQKVWASDFFMYLIIGIIGNIFTRKGYPSLGVEEPQAIYKKKMRHADFIDDIENVSLMGGPLSCLTCLAKMKTPSRM